MLGTIFNFFLAVMGLILLAAGVLNVKEGIKKRNFGKSFCEGGGMLFFGIIITLAWINTFF